MRFPLWRRSRRSANACLTAGVTKRVLKSTAYALVVVAAIAVLLATNLLPVLQVSGDSMNPTLQDQDILVLLKTDTLEKGDLCGFYWQNKLLLKRIIGIPGM